MTSPTPSPPTCPRCGARGRKVSHETPLALLRDEARAHLTDAPVRFCRTPDCDVVYYAESGAPIFTTGDVRVTVYQKSSDPDRLVCYCFGHSVRAIEDEVAATGTSRVPDEITEACRAGRDDCPHKNPQGACCLGNVRQVVRAAQLARGTPAEASPSASCCSCGSDGDEPTRAGACVVEPGPT